MPDSRTNFVMCINLLVGLLFCAVGGWLIGEAFVWMRNRNAVQVDLLFTNDHGGHLVYDPGMIRYSSNDSHWVTHPVTSNWVASGTTNTWITNAVQFYGKPFYFTNTGGVPTETVKQTEDAFWEDTETDALYRYQNGKWQKYVPQP